MTAEEAIEYIKTNCYGEWCEDDWRNAMDMAIESMEAWIKVGKLLGLTERGDEK